MEPMPTDEWMEWMIRHTLGRTMKRRFTEVTDHRTIEGALVPIKDEEQGLVS